MKDALKDIAFVLVGIYVFASAVYFPLTVLAFHMAKNDSDFFEKRYKFEYEKGQYFFNGANERQLLEICPTEDGNPAVLFKKDCYAKVGNN